LFPVDAEDGPVPEPLEAVVPDQISQPYVPVLVLRGLAVQQELMVFGEAVNDQGADSKDSAVLDTCD
jgi:hypothetical protein